MCVQKRAVLSAVNMHPSIAFSIAMSRTKFGVWCEDFATAIEEFCLLLPCQSAAIHRCNIVCAQSTIDKSVRVIQHTRRYHFPRQGNKKDSLNGSWWRKDFFKTAWREFLSTAFVWKKGNLFAIFVSEYVLYCISLHGHRRLCGVRAARRMRCASSMLQVRSQKRQMPCSPHDIVRP